MSRLLVANCWHANAWCPAVFIYSVIKIIINTNNSLHTSLFPHPFPDHSRLCCWLLWLAAQEEGKKHCCFINSKHHPPLIEKLFKFNLTSLHKSSPSIHGVTQLLRIIWKPFYNAGSGNPHHYIKWKKRSSTGNHLPSTDCSAMHVYESFHMCIKEKHVTGKCLS